MTEPGRPGGRNRSACPASVAGLFGSSVPAAQAARWHFALFKWTTLIGASVVLGACASQEHRPTRESQLPVIAPIHAIAAPPATEPADLWSILRRGFRFAQCDDGRVRHWARHYTRNSQVFTRQMSRALPQLRYVANIVLDADVPAEFVLLPWVESNFRALPGHGRGAAGMWQIMPATGREIGLRVDRHFDGRLALDQSTRAVVHMLRRDYRMLDSWPLTDMAFNAGVYRIRRLSRDLDESVLGQAIPDLDVKPVTLDHLAKLQALACIVKQPARYSVALPAPDSGMHLQRRNLSEVLELPVAARLAGLSTAELRALNPAIRDRTAPASSLILPARHAPAFDRNYSRLKQFDWQQWQRVRLARSTDLLKLAHGDLERARALALVNKRLDNSGGKPISANSVLWLPVNLVAALPEDMRASLSGVPRQYTVQSGDSLWSIARRFHLGIGQLRSWNRLRGDLLHLGQVLILEP